MDTTLEVVVLALPSSGCADQLNRVRGAVR
jgi:hypothetical protein